MMKTCSNIFLFTVAFLFVATSGAQVKDSAIIYFDFNKSLITPAAAQTIHNLFAMNKESFHIEKASLYGHCDNIGNDQYNDSLSMARVNSTRAYLDSFSTNKINFRLLTGLGERHPVNDNLTAEQRAQNRRVLIVVDKTPVEKDSPVPNKAPGKPLQPAGDINEIADSATKVGDHFIIKNLLFFGGRHFPLEQSFDALDQLVELLRKNPNIKIEIQGYVCCTPESLDGYDYDNRTLDLSLQRAKYVYGYLVKKGIDKQKLSYRGFGGLNKIYPEEANEFEKTNNRRVEIKILEK